MSEDFCGRYHPTYHTHTPDSMYVDDHPRDPGGGDEGVIWRCLGARLRGGGEVVGGDEVLGGSAATATLEENLAAARTNFSPSPRHADQFCREFACVRGAFCTLPYKSGRLGGPPRARTAARKILG